MHTVLTVKPQSSFDQIIDNYDEDLATLIDVQARNLLRKYAKFFPLSLSKFWCLEIPLHHEKKKLISYFVFLTVINVTSIL
jgi:hypothetical protein